MNLVAVTITAKGTTEERLHLRATSAVDLSSYVVFDTMSVSPGTVNAGQRTAYWFGPKKIQAGHNVVLYTRAGTPSSETRADGTVYHFLFRGVSAPLYGSPQSRAVVFELNTWQTTTDFS